MSDDVSLTAYIAAAMLELDANAEARPTFRLPWLGAAAKASTW